MSDYDTSDDDRYINAKGNKVKWSKHEVRAVFGLKNAAFPLTNVTIPPGVALLLRQDNTLKEAVKKYGKENWKRVAEVFGNDRTEAQCQARWVKVLSPNVVKGPWTKEVPLCASGC